MIKQFSFVTSGISTPWSTWAKAFRFFVLGGLVASLQVVFGPAVMAQTTTSMAQVPLLALKSAPGLVLLTMSRDQRLFYAAYNELTDLQGLGSPDVGYKETFNYYGYFVSDRCYAYDSSNSRFSPKSLASPTDGCKFAPSSARWHGNWLNWMTTSRMDALRKVLYGGKRGTLTDTPTLTVLEAAHIPPDSHIWGKEFRPTAAGGTDGYDIAEYTPLDAPLAGKQHIFLMKSETTSTSPYIGLTVPTLRVAKNVDATIDRVWLWASSERPVGGPFGTTTYNRQNAPGNDKVVNPTPTLISYGVPGFPNATSGGTAYGSFSTTYAYNLPVRVEACVNLTVGGRENGCTGYPSAAPTIYKPTGVLHDYGVNDSLKFGLLTGSYTNNYSGGVLRKDIGSFTDEYMANTGIFTNVPGIVKTINAFTTIGFNGNNQIYVSNTTVASCPPNDFMWDRLRCQGEVYMWGSPVAEMMYEGIRYFTAPTAGPLSAFTSGVSSSSSPDSQLGLPLVTSWANPFRASGGSAICSRPLQMVIADPITSFDSDQVPGAAFSPDTGRGTAIPVTDLTGLNVSTQADQIWAAEFGASSKNFFIGQTTATNADGNPSAKSASTFKYIRGHAPDETNTQGSYYAASIAKFAHGTYDASGSQLTGVSVGPTAATKVLKPVDTISVALGSVVPKFEISFGGRKVSLVPFVKSVSGGCTPAPAVATTAPSGFQPTGLITGMFIDRIANTTASNYNSSINGGLPFARFMVSFSDMDVGGDNESDFNVYYTVSFNASGQLTVLISPYNTATCVVQHAGYVISGTTTDGVYLEVRNTPNPAATAPYYLDTPPGVAAWTSARGAPAALSATTATRTFTLAASSGSSATYIPHDPLWYAAKYGGAGVLDSNGDPTNYFKVTNPSNLPSQMGRAFRAAAALASVSSTSVVGVGQRSAGSAAIYQANYDSLTWSSRLYAFKVDASGVVSNTPLWEASSKLPAPVSRSNLYLGRGGSTAPFALTSGSYASLSSSGSPSEQTDFGSTSVYEYVLGDKSKEERKGGTLRNRGSTAASDAGSVLGDIVNSDPQIIAKKDYGYTASDATYTSFLAGITTESLAVGSNDGFFHIFDATPAAAGGGELLGFLPQAARTNIKDLAPPTYSHRYFVDGSIGLGHAKIAVPGDSTPSWRSVVVAAGGAGAQTVFAVNTTSQTYSANSVLWEINANTTLPSGATGTFGNVMGRPAIGKLKNGTWVAIFGNGYNSTAGTANLYVVQLDSGAILKVIPTNGTTANGLGSTEIVKTTSGNKDTIDYVYGADYKGNIWRFDLSASSIASWPSKGALLYSTPSGRPITAEIRVGDATGSPSIAGGKMVYFGTGAYLNSVDVLTTSPQALYGIYDDLLGTSSTSAAVAESTLVVMSLTMASSSSDVRSSSSVTTPWYSTSGKKGWVLPLSGTNVVVGERVIAPPVRYTVPGKVDAFLFTSIVPGTDECVAGVDAWITGVDAMTGGFKQVFDGLTTANSVKIAGGSPRGVFVLQDGADPTLFISQTIFNDTIPTTSFTTSAGGQQQVTIGGVVGKTQVLGIKLVRNAAVAATVRQIWRQLK